MKRIFCDFDGTITSRDSIAFLTEEFGAGPDHRMKALEGIRSGTMTVFEAIGLELETVKATWEEAVAGLEQNISLDPTFPGFVNWCRNQDIPLIVVSSGLSPVVELFIGRFDLPCFAQSVQIRPDGWLYERIPAHDKENILKEAPRQEEIIFLGDGTSDVAAIPYADRLFARRGFYLEEHCRENNVPFVPFSDFVEIRQAIESEVTV